MKPLLPIHYRLEIHFDSFVNDAVVTYESSTPFLSISIGDTIELRSIDNFEPEIFSNFGKVTDIIHYLYEIENHHIGHGIGVCVELKKLKKNER